MSIGESQAHQWVNQILNMAQFSLEGSSFGTLAGRVFKVVMVAVVMVSNKLVLGGNWGSVTCRSDSIYRDACKYIVPK